MLQLWTGKRDCPEESGSEDFISQAVSPQYLQSCCSHYFCGNKVYLDVECTPYIFPCQHISESQTLATHGMLGFLRNFLHNVYYVACTCYGRGIRIHAGMSNFNVILCMELGGFKNLHCVSICVFICVKLVTIYQMIKYTK